MKKAKIESREGVKQSKEAQINPIRKRVREIELIRSASMVSVFVCVALLCYGVAIFFINLHNLDQAHDLTVFALRVERNPDDWTLCYDNGKCASFFDVYGEGLYGMKKSIPLLIGASMAFAVNLIAMTKAFSIPFPQAVKGGLE